MGDTLTSFGNRINSHAKPPRRDWLWYIPIMTHMFYIPALFLDAGKLGMFRGWKNIFLGVGRREIVNREL
jgi:hypothetical protein